MNISAIILSAGSSMRMGSPKALLTINGKTFLQHIVENVLSCGISEIIIVLGCEPESIQQSLNWFSGKTVINNDWKQGQLSSIIAGLNALDESQTSAALIWPVDHPLVSTETIQSLVENYRNVKKKIVVPKYEKRRGHPVIISSELFQEIKNSPIDIGMKFVVRAHPGDVAEVVTGDKGIITNIDTPEDYRQFIK